MPAAQLKHDVGLDINLLYVIGWPAITVSRHTVVWDIRQVASPTLVPCDCGTHLQVIGQRKPISPTKRSEDDGIGELFIFWGYFRDFLLHPPELILPADLIIQDQAARRKQVYMAQPVGCKPDHPFSLWMCHPLFLESLAIYRRKGIRNRQKVIIKELVELQHFKLNYIDKLFYRVRQFYR